MNMNVGILITAYNDGLILKKERKYSSKYGNALKDMSLELYSMEKRIPMVINNL